MIQTFLQHNTHHVLHRFRYFVLPQASTRHHKYWIYQTICQAKPIKFIIKLCTDHYNLWDNTLPNKKAESARAVLFQSQTARSTTTPSSIQSMLIFLQSGRYSFIFRTLFVQTTTPTISTKNSFFFSQFSPPYSTLTYSQIHPYNPY